MYSINTQDYLDQIQQDIPESLAKEAISSSSGRIMSTSRDGHIVYHKKRTVCVQDMSTDSDYGSEWKDPSVTFELYIKRVELPRALGPDSLNNGPNSSSFTSAAVPIPVFAPFCEPHIGLISPGLPGIVMQDEQQETGIYYISWFQVAEGQWRS